MTEQTPQRMPPSGTESETTSEALQSPVQMPADEVATQATLGDTIPSLTPPTAAGTSIEAFSGTWQNSKNITALWSIDQNRNSFIHIAGVGWRRLANNSDSAVVALGMLASHAMQLNRPANLFEDANQIKQIYVW